MKNIKMAILERRIFLFKQAIALLREEKRVSGIFEIALRKANLKLKSDVSKPRGWSHYIGTIETNQEPRLRQAGTILLPPEQGGMTRREERKRTDLSVSSELTQCDVMLGHGFTKDDG